jgi:hypothetical protein
MYGPPRVCKGKLWDEYGVCANVFGLSVEPSTPGHERRVWHVRFFIWYRFLWQVSKIPLNLIPTHPDRAGGLGFLGLSPSGLDLETKIFSASGLGETSLLTSLFIELIEALIGNERAASR